MKRGPRDRRRESNQKKGNGKENEAIVGLNSMALQRARPTAESSPVPLCCVCVVFFFFFSLLSHKST